MIELAAPRAVGALVEAFGGVLDDGVDAALDVRSIGASDEEGDVDVAPILHARGASRRVASARLWLVDGSVAARVEVGARWVHPAAMRVVASLLAHDESAAFDEAHAVAPGANLGRGVVVEPGARVGRDVVIGAGSRIGCHVVIHPGVTIGARVFIGAGAIVGGQGFGFVDGVQGRGEPPVRIPHRGGVVIEDDVEIGPLSTVDAGVLSATRVGRGTKIDAHVHIGHGVRIGARCRIAAQCGFAGSVVVGDDVWMGGQVGVGDHVEIGRGARIAGKSGVIGDVAAGVVVAGYPAVARGRWLRGQARIYRG